MYQVGDERVIEDISDIRGDITVSGVSGDERVIEGILVYQVTKG